MQFGIDTALSKGVEANSQAFVDSRFKDGSSETLNTRTRHGNRRGPDLSSGKIAGP
jgi:hypothetical protein